MEEWPTVRPERRSPATLKCLISSICLAWRSEYRAFKISICSSWSMFRQYSLSAPDELRANRQWRRPAGEGSTSEWLTTRPELSNALRADDRFISARPCLVPQRTGTFFGHTFDRRRGPRRRQKIQVCPASKALQGAEGMAADL